MMPQNQRVRLNWLDRIVLGAAAVVVVAAALVGHQVSLLKGEIRTSRAVTCAGQLAVTSSTVPVCRPVAHLAQDQ